MLPCSASFKSVTNCALKPFSFNSSVRFLPDFSVPARIATVVLSLKNSFKSSQSTVNEPFHGATCFTLNETISLKGKSK